MSISTRQLSPCVSGFQPQHVLEFVGKLSKLVNFDLIFLKLCMRLHNVLVILNPRSTIVPGNGAVLCLENTNFKGIRRKMAFNVCSLFFNQETCEQREIRSNFSDAPPQAPAVPGDQVLRQIKLLNLILKAAILTLEVNVQNLQHRSEGAAICPQPHATN